MELSTISIADKLWELRDDFQQFFPEDLGLTEAFLQLIFDMAKHLLTQKDEVQRFLRKSPTVTESDLIIWLARTPGLLPKCIHTNYKQKEKKIVAGERPFAPSLVHTAIINVGNNPGFDNFSHDLKNHHVKKLSDNVDYVITAPPKTKAQLKFYEEEPVEASNEPSDPLVCFVSPDKIVETSDEDELYAGGETIAKRVRLDNLQTKLSTPNQESVGNQEGCKKMLKTPPAKQTKKVKSSKRNRHGKAANGGTFLKLRRSRQKLVSKHNVSKTNLETFHRCSFCSSHFDNFVALKNHLETHYLNKEYGFLFKCNSCEFQTQSDEHFEFHYAEQGCYYCPQCKNTYNGQEGVISHFKGACQICKV